MRMNLPEAQVSDMIKEIDRAVGRLDMIPQKIEVKHDARRVVVYFDRDECDVAWRFTYADIAGLNGLDRSLAWTGVKIALVTFNCFADHEETLAEYEAAEQAARAWAYRD